MKINNKYKTALYSFLEKQGVLQADDDNLIKAAKRAYWLDYKKRWNKTKRKEYKSFTVFFNQKELRMITNAATEYNTSPTNFIKQSALASKNLINQEAVGKIRELLSLNYNALESLTEEDKLPGEIGNLVLARIASLEKEVLGILHSNSNSIKMNHF